MTRDNIQKTSDLRVALIKQSYHPDLYICEPKTPDYFKYSPFRSGPLGLSQAFQVDFYIVEEHDSEECKTWRQKIKSLTHRDPQSWLSVPRTYQIDGRPQGDFAINVEEIDFQAYDIAISFDIAIPTHIVKKNPTVLWCYYITEPPMEAYQESLAEPLFGYDIFLNQRFRAHSVQAKAEEISKHCIDFPYVFASTKTYDALFGPKAELQWPDFLKTKVAIPNYVLRELSNETIRLISEHCDIVTPKGRIDNFIKSLSSCQFYLRPGNAPKFGNETIEAVASGLTFIASPWGWKNRIFNVDGTTINPKSNIDMQAREGLEIILSLKKDSKLHDNIKSYQASLLDDICYHRPLYRLLQEFYSKQLRIA